MLNNLRRTKNNDLVLASSKMISLQNIILVASLLLLVLAFTGYYETNATMISKAESFSLNRFYSELFYQSNVSELTKLLIKTSIFSPVIYIALYIVNFRLNNRATSYRIVMAQYAAILFFGVVLSNASAMLLNGSKMFGMFGLSEYVSVTFFGMMHRLFSFIIMIAAIFGIVETGHRHIDEAAVVSEVFTKESLDKAMNFADKAKSNIGAKMSKPNQDSSNAQVQNPAADVNQVQQVNQNVNVNTNTNASASSPSANTTFCSECGSPNVAGAKFCRQCGNKMD